MLPHIISTALSFMEYLLESSDLKEDLYKVFEGTLIWGSCAIRHLVGKIVKTMATMLPNKDFVVGFFDRVAQDPSQLVVWSQKLELSPDSQFDTNEPLTGIGNFYRHYTMSAYHVSFDAQVENLVSHWCGLALVSYHPLWDGLALFSADGIERCKLDHLQYRYTQDNLSEVRVGDSDSGTYGCYHLHSVVGCECQFGGDSSVNRVGISVGLSFDGFLPPSVLTIGFQMILPLILVIWELVLQEPIMCVRDIAQFHTWDPSGLWCTFLL